MEFVAKARLGRVDDSCCICKLPAWWRLRTRRFVRMEARLTIDECQILLCMKVVDTPTPSGKL